MNLEEILLTDEEIGRTLYGDESVMWGTLEKERAIAKAGVKKLVGWLGEPNRTFFNGEKRIIMLFEEDWQALRRKLGLT